MAAAAAERRGPEIPGMYYDKEKNRYFKIEAGTAHSTDVIKRRRLNDSKADEERAQKLLRKPYIKRSQVMQDPLLGGLLRRETGGRHAHAEAVAAGFSGSELIFKDVYDPKSSIPAFAWDSVTRGLFVSRYEHKMLCAVPKSQLQECDSNATKRQRISHNRIYQADNCMNMVYEPKKISSINVNEAARLVAVTWIDIDHFGVVVGNLADQVAVPNDLDRQVSDGSHIHIRHSRWKENITVWTSTPAPASSSLSFAIGMDDHVMTIEKGRANAQWIVNSDSKTREVLALEFLQNQPSVLLAGDRRGEISLLDIRADNPKFGQDVIENRSAVTHIKSLDDYRVLVAGPGDGEIPTMFQYDLRWREKMSIKGSRQRKGKFCTRPVLEYPGHVNPYPKFGLDVDLDAGLVAAAQEDQTVQLFSLHGGHKIDYAGKDEKREYPIECLRFVPDREDSVKSLYMAGSDSIYRYAW